MKRKKMMVCTLLAGSMLLAACGSKSAEDTVTDTTTYSQSESANQSAAQEASDTVTGMIQSMEDSTITLAIMNMPDGEAPSGEAPNGSAPEMPDGEAPSDEAPNGSAPEMPDGEAPSGEAPNGSAPEMPDGEAPSGEAPSGSAPEMPDGEAPSGEAPNGSAPEMPGGEATTITITLTDATIFLDASGNSITLDDLQENAMITVEIDENNNAMQITLSNAGFGMGGSGNSQSAPTSYTASNHYTDSATLSGETISSTGTDENAVLVTDGASVSLDQMTVTRTSSDSTGGDASSFYGIGAAVLATDGTVEISNSTIETDASGAAGVFAYADGIAYVSDSVITSQQDTSGGIHVAGGGTLYATNLTVETNGESAAAIRSDRGGGTMTVDGGSYTSNGSGSPAIYSTADITVANADLIANGSEAVCIEGLNSLSLTDCNLTGNMPDLSQNDCTWTVILYQSMSGDSEIGNSTFRMEGGTLTSKNGGLFYTTNTESTFYLSDVEIISTDDCEFFLKCTGNQNQRGWGQSGANGADCSFTAEAQTMSGDILWDSISTLDFVMKQNSSLSGAFKQDESAVMNSGNGYANLSIDETSTWIVTGNSTLSSLKNQGTIVDENQNTVTIQGTDGTVYVKGTSPYTITVSAYEN
ncbi:MAG: hypothetical protein UFG06_11095 [Lachnospiraceae bacterium]|nr:hypothetical protein [Lachnospiraceae bacterium]